jgi:hypothetical protein
MTEQRGFRTVTGVLADAEQVVALAVAEHAARSPEASDDGQLPATSGMPSTVLRPGTASVESIQSMQCMECVDRKPGAADSLRGLVAYFRDPPV